MTRPPKKSKATTKPQSWRVSLLRQRAHHLGTVEASDERAAEAAAVAQFDLNEEQRASGLWCERRIKDGDCEP
jgi:hypothetical protein